MAMNYLATGLATLANLSDRRNDGFSMPRRMAYTRHFCVVMSRGSGRVRAGTPGPTLAEGDDRSAAIESVTALLARDTATGADTDPGALAGAGEIPVTSG